MTLRTRVAVIVAVNVAMVAIAVAGVVVWDEWSFAALLSAGSIGGLTVAARLVRIGHYAPSNVAMGILAVAYGIGFVCSGLVLAHRVGFLFAIAGVIELGAGIHYLRKPDVAAHASDGGAS